MGDINRRQSINDEELAGVLAKCQGYEELPVDPTQRIASTSESATKYLQSIDESLITIKSILKFLVVLMIMGIVVGAIAALAH